MKSHQVELIMGRIFISVLVTIICLITLEMLSRQFISIRPPFEQRFPVQQYRHPYPYVMFSGEPSSPGLNTLGYKGKVPAMPKPLDEFRIFLVGGSTVVNGDPSISRILEELFHQEGLPAVKMYNFGVVSSVSGMELSKIVFELSELEPDMIVMYNGGNDLLHPYSWDPRPGYPFNFVAYENNPLLRNDLESYPTFALMAYGSHFMRYAFRSYFIRRFAPLEQLRAESHYRSLEWEEKIAENYVNNLYKAETLSKAFGADFMAFFQPLVYFKRRLSKEEQGFVSQADTQCMQEIRTFVMKKITHLQNTSDVNIVDLSSIYQDEINWIFTDAIHTKQEAKPLIAQAIYQYISRQISIQHLLQ